MKRAVICIVFALTVTLTASAAEAVGPNLDVAGIKVGMSLKDALAAVKADDPQFHINVDAHKLEGVSGEVHPCATASAMGDNPALVTEDIRLLFTMAPGAEVVWGIQRTCGYKPDHRPGMDNTVAAIRAKYGPESLHQVMNNGQIQYMTWVFDAQGERLSEDKAKAVAQTCCINAEAHFGGQDSMAMNALNSGNFGPPQCAGLRLIKASLQGTPIDATGTAFSVVTLTVQVSDDELYRKAIEPIRASMVRAANARENKAMEDVNKQGAPGL